MQKVLSLAAAFAVAAGSAIAADLPYRKERPKFTPPPPPLFLWTGGYVGLNAGGTWNADTSVQTVTTPLFRSPAIVAASPTAIGLAASGNRRLEAGGFIGGGQIGYNWQVHPLFVVGLETDIQGVAGNDATIHHTGVAPIAGGAGAFWLANVDQSASLDYLGTVRGRIGYLVMPTLLLYGTGGFAYGGVSAQTNISWVGVRNGGLPVVANSAFLGGGRVETTLPGWTAGGGAEWAFWPNWSAKLEYLFYDLGSVENNFVSVRTTPAGAPLVLTNTRTSTRFEGNIVRAGLNYHFNLGSPFPVYAKY